jgi:ribosome-associated heat shock protein Hsp15
VSDGVRLDKWLQVARVFKTRTQATEACSRGQVTVNAMPAKPHRNLAVGDRVEVELGDWRRVLVVRELADRPLAKAEVPRLFEDLSAPRPVLDPLERLLRKPLVRRDAGAGRPTKRERRQLEREVGRRG